MKAMTKHDARRIAGRLRCRKCNAALILVGWHGVCPEGHGKMRPLDTLDMQALRRIKRENVVPGL